MIPDLFVTHPCAKKLLAEGKTKRIFETANNPHHVYVVSKSDITAGDGAKHDVIEGKAELANNTACNVFRLLKANNIPSAFIAQIDPSLDSAFLAESCAMLPYEVVVRREAHGSYLKRKPDIEKGFVFPDLLVEFFLKTSGKKWLERGYSTAHELVCDDPLMDFNDDGSIGLYDPSKPFGVWAIPFLLLHQSQVFFFNREKEFFAEMSQIARKTFCVLEEAWKKQGGKLVDFKVEFGISAVSGNLVLSDVIDNDSWRVIEDGVHLDKQVYRDGSSLSEVTEKYRRVAEITSRFLNPAGQ